MDAVVGWARAGADPATVLASRYGCPLPAAPEAEPTGEPSAAAGTAATEAPEAADEDSEDAPNPEAPSNISGLCDPALQQGIDAALRGVGDVGQVISQAEPRLWDLAAVLPILQDTTVVAAGPDVDGVTLSGAIEVGIFGDAANWSRTQG